MVPFQLDELFASMIARKGPDQWQVLEEVDGLGWSLRDERKTGKHRQKLR
jgi:hypothetical protein